MTRVAPLLVLMRAPEEIGEEQLEQLRKLAWGDGAAGTASILARALAASLLAERWGRPPDALRFVCTPQGKPSVCDDAGTPGPTFSLSHTSGWVAVAVGDGGSVGVDVQSTAEPNPSVGRRVFAESDRDALEALEPDAAREEYTRLWTVAEACAKADGGGLPILLAGFDPIGPSASGTWRSMQWWSGRMSGGHWAVAYGSDELEPGSSPTVREVPMAAILAPQPTARTG
jgi:phosphopantetheinyl transferase